MSKEMTPAGLRSMTRTLCEALADKSEPQEVMTALLKTYAETDMSGSDLLKILAGACILQARAANNAAHTGYSVILRLILLLYPWKTLDECNAITAAVLMGDCPHDGAEEEEGPALRVVFIRRHED